MTECKSKFYYRCDNCKWESSLHDFNPLYVPFLCAVCCKGYVQMIFENKDIPTDSRTSEEVIYQLCENVKLSKEYDTDYTREITCPHCNYEFGDSWEYKENNSHIECQSCGKEFEYTRDVEVTYCTNKLT